LESDLVRGKFFNKFGAGPTAGLAGAALAFFFGEFAKDPIENLSSYLIAALYILATFFTIGSTFKTFHAVFDVK
jgi:hypothetical protein